MSNQKLVWTYLLLGRLACFAAAGHGGGYASAGSSGSASASASSFSSPGCMTCLCQAATGCDVNKQCVGDVCGAFAISWQYWKDAGQPGGDYVSCANNPNCALNCVQNYVNKFAQDCDGNGVVDCADAARLHRLGRTGCSGWLDDEFASRLSSCDASAAPSISTIFAQAKPISPQSSPRYQDGAYDTAASSGCSTCSGYVGSSGPNSGNSNQRYVGSSSGSGYATGTGGSKGIGYGGSGSGYVGNNVGSTGLSSGSSGSNAAGYVVGNSGQPYRGSTGSGYVGGSGVSKGIGYGSSGQGYVGNNVGSTGLSSGSSGSNGASYVANAGQPYRGSTGSGYVGGSGSNGLGYNSGSGSGSSYVGSTGMSPSSSGYGSGGSGYSSGSSRYPGNTYSQSAGPGPAYQRPAYQGGAGGSSAAASASTSASAAAQSSSGWQGYSGGGRGSSGTGLVAGGSGFNTGSGYGTGASAGSYAGAAVSDYCLSCICNAATGCSLSAGCNHAGCGPLRISKAYWIDAGSPGGDYNGCTNNMECSMNCAKSYLTKYAKDCDGDGVVQCGDYARIHRLGAYGCNGELDWQFQSQIETCSD